MYTYCRKDGTVMAESDSEITFNEKLLPALAAITPVVKDETESTTEETKEEK